VKQSCPSSATSVSVDPVNVVAPSHILTLWSGSHFRLSDLDRLLWDEKKLFEHWSHAASIVPPKTIRSSIPNETVSESFPSLGEDGGRRPERGCHYTQNCEEHPACAEARTLRLSNLKIMSEPRDEQTDGALERCLHDALPLAMSGDVMVVGLKETRTSGALRKRSSRVRGEE